MSNLARCYKSTEIVRKAFRISPDNRNTTEQRERKSLIPNNRNCDAQTFKPKVVGSIPTAPTKAFCFQSIGSLRTLQPEQGVWPRSRFDLAKSRGFNDLRRRGAVCEAPSRPGIPTASTSIAWIETQDRTESVLGRSRRGAGCCVFRRAAKSPRSPCWFHITPPLDNFRLADHS